MYFQTLVSILLVKSCSSLRLFLPCLLAYFLVAILRVRFFLVSLSLFSFAFSSFCSVFFHSFHPFILLCPSFHSAIFLPFLDLFPFCPYIPFFLPSVISFLFSFCVLHFCPFQLPSLIVICPSSYSCPNISYVCLFVGSFVSAILIHSFILSCVPSFVFVFLL